MRGIMVYCDENKNEIREVSLLKLPIKEEVINKESIKLYEEPEPCIIYKTTIINKTGLSLHSELKEKNITDKLYDIEELKLLIGDILELPNEVRFVKFI